MYQEITVDASEDLVRVFFRGANQPVGEPNLVDFCRGQSLSKCRGVKAIDGFEASCAQNSNNSIVENCRSCYAGSLMCRKLQAVSLERRERFG